MRVRLNAVAHKTKRYMWNTLISLDRFINTLLGGSYSETISGRAYRCNDSFLWRVAEVSINLIFFWDFAVVDDQLIGHCEISYYMDRRREVTERMKRLLHEKRD